MLDLISIIYRESPNAPARGLIPREAELLVLRRKAERPGGRAVRSCLAKAADGFPARHGLGGLLASFLPSLRFLAPLLSSLGFGQLP